jgi:hypothetical protein
MSSFSLGDDEIGLIVRGLEARGTAATDDAALLETVVAIDEAPGGPKDRGENVSAEEYRRALERWAAGIEPECVWEDEPG